LRRRGFAKLFAGQGVSALGDWMATVAFMAIVLQLTGSTTAVGGILVLRLAPGIVAADLAGRAAHRLGRRRTMLAMDLLRAAMAVVIPLGALVPQLLALWWVYLWAFLLEVATLLFLPARDSTIPDLVDPAETPAANNLILASSYGMIPLGAAVFALASIASLDITQAAMLAIFWIDGLTFVVSYELIRRIGRQELAGATAISATAEAESSGSIREAFSIPLVRRVLPALLTIALALGGLFSLGVALVQEVLAASATQFGALIALFGVGAGGGMAVLQWLGPREGMGQLRVAVTVLGATIFLTAAAPMLWVAYLGAVGFGGAVAYSLARGMGILQGRLDGQERVLAFTSFHILVRGGLGVGAIVTGTAADVLGRVSWPLLGSLEPSRVVLFAAGLVVAASAALVREPAAEQAETRHLPNAS
jgi:MFS family permease